MNSEALSQKQAFFSLVASEAILVMLVPYPQAYHLPFLPVGTPSWALLAGFGILAYSQGASGGLR